MRRIILDTETTGISPEHGHRLIEIACIEMLDRELTGRHFHQYINPERLVDEGAFRVHGISDEFLTDKPLFRDIAFDLLGFIDGAELIIHNAAFDIGFLNAELQRIQHEKKISDHCSVFCTLDYARKKHPGQKNNLDALCKRYEIDNSNRTLHGALLDAEILAAVYLAMTGGQSNLFEENTYEETHRSAVKQTPVQVIKTRFIQPTAEELAAHEKFISELE